MALNNYTPALADKEVKSTAKSVARWTFDHIGKGHSEAFIAKQKQRGALGGKAKGEAYADTKSQAKALFDDGVSNTAIAKQLNISRMTVIRWIEKGFL